jgi:hypothetical protein
VAAGVVAAIRTKYPPSRLSPAELRQLLRRTAEDLSPSGFDYDRGFGLIDVSALLNALERNQVKEIRVGETVSGRLNQGGDSLLYRMNIGLPVTLELDGENGADFDLYVRKRLPPTINNFDLRGFTNSSDETVRIQPSSPGEYSIMVYSNRGFGNFTLKATRT